MIPDPYWPPSLEHRPTDNGRHSIWSVSQSDQRLFSVLFPAIWFTGMVFHVLHKKPWSKDVFEAAVSLTESIATAGIAAAILAMMILAMRGGIMVLFDWATEQRRKWREEGREQGREEERTRRDQEWDAWLARFRQAQERGEEFTEPPPSARNRSGRA